MKPSTKRMTRYLFSILLSPPLSSIHRRLSSNAVAAFSFHYKNNNVIGSSSAFSHPTRAFTFLKSTNENKDSISLSRRPFYPPKNAPDDSASSEAVDALAWDKLGLLSDLVDAVKFQDFHTPTPVQKITIPPLLAKENIAFAAATGSGKTLAYLLPIIQSLKSEEILHASSNSTTPLRKARRPRALILSPTRELTEQILSVIKSLSHTCKISSMSLVGGEDAGIQRKKLQKSPVDILVATPGRFVKRWDDGDVSVGSIRYIVLDETDTMLEQGFQADIGKVLNVCLYRKQGVDPDRDPLVPDPPQVILTTATMTNAVKRLLKIPGVKQKKLVNAAVNLPPDMRLIEAPGLHRAVPRLRQLFIDVGSTDKLSLLVDLIQNAASRNEDVLPHTLIFCNTLASCRATEHALAESSVPALNYHGDMSSTARSENLAAFRDGEVRILVCTDIASRGLDVPTVDHVIMFDFPLNSIDYLHRAGRTARGDKGKGTVTALVAKRDKVLAMAIENAVRTGMPLDQLSSNKSDYMPGGKLGAKRVVEGSSRSGRGGKRRDDRGSRGRSSKKLTGGKGGRRGRLRSR